MKYNLAKVLQDMADKIVMVNGRDWSFDRKFVSNFKGPKRIRKKKAKRFISRAIETIVVPYAKGKLNE